jgi:histone-binding protein RBBP4
MHRIEIGAHTDTSPRIKIQQSIPHNGEVNRARYMPQNVDLIATKTAMGEVYVFDRTKHSLVPKDGEECRPEITLRGQKKEGCARVAALPTMESITDPVVPTNRYGLAWNPTNEGKGRVLSASEDTTVCEWCARKCQEDETLPPPFC